MLRHMYSSARFTWIRQFSSEPAAVGHAEYLRKESTIRPPCYVEHLQMIDMMLKTRNGLFQAGYQSSVHSHVFIVRAVTHIAARIGTPFREPCSTTTPRIPSSALPLRKSVAERRKGAQTLKSSLFYGDFSAMLRDSDVGRHHRD